MNNQVVIVTGGGRGIGQAIALALAGQGARVTVAARSTGDLEATAKLLVTQARAPYLVLRCDVTKPADVQSLFALVGEKLGPVYGLVCAAGVYGPIGPIEDLDLAEWESALNINVMGTVRCVQAAIPEMKRQKRGRIILFSGGGQVGMPRFSAYTASKGAIWRLTETLGLELASQNIFVNALAPGAVNTKLLQDVLAAGPERVGAEMYKKSLQQKETGGQSPQPAVDLVNYLLAPESTGLAGKILSAVWDDYRKISDPAKISQTDLYTMRRVIRPDGGTRTQ